MQSKPSNFLSQMDLTHFKNVLDASVHGKLKEFLISQVSIDSRANGNLSNTLFIALKGDRHDAHKYIGDVYAQGGRVFVVNKNFKIPAKLEADCCFFSVENTLVAMQSLAKHCRSMFTGDVIAITGSNGKTMVKEWLFQMLGDDYVIHRSPKSYNSQVGVALSLLSLNNRYSISIIEAGISKVGEMEKLEAMIQPTFGVFTNLGSAHSSGFNGQPQKLQEKLKLFKNSKKILLLQGVKEENSINGIAVDNNQDSTCRIRLEKVENDYHLEVEVQNKTILFLSPFKDSASNQNLSLVIGVALFLSKGMDIDIIPKRVKGLSPINMRLEVIQGVRNVQIINDSYSNDLDSLAIALNFLKSQAAGGESWVVLSDILESGKSSTEIYSRVKELLKFAGIKKWIGIGSQIQSHAPSGNGFLNTEQFLKEFDLTVFNNSNLLLKGARKFQFEAIVKKFQEKTHETVFEISLTTLEENFHNVRTQLPLGVKIMAIVKAFSYGAGAFEIAKLLQFNQVDYLGVAYVDEGVELRNEGIKVPILVMNPELTAIDQIINNDLNIAVFSLKMLKDLHIIHQKKKKQIKIHLKFETGMNRLGIHPNEVSEVSSLLDPDVFELNGVFTHLAAADEPEHDDFTQNQFDCFDEIVIKLKTELNRPFLAHCLNTAGIGRFRDYAYDMVRMGIGLYGFDPSGSLSGLKPAGRLITHISQIKFVEKGDSVGYSRKFVAPIAMKIAILPIGYADGFRRSLGNGLGHVIIKGKKVPIVGNVCMDMTMVDISNMDVEEGSEVEIFGESHTLMEFSKEMNTIPYEVLTGISQRVKRIFYRE
ncbi:MAG: alanine racemase [Sphingobacteriales bacterium]|jgi:alanine racemase